MLNEWTFAYLFVGFFFKIAWFLFSHKTGYISVSTVLWITLTLNKVLNNNQDVFEYVLYLLYICVWMKSSNKSAWWYIFTLLYYETCPVIIKGFLTNYFFLAAKKKKRKKKICLICIETKNLTVTLHNLGVNVCWIGVVQLLRTVTFFRHEHSVLSQIRHGRYSASLLLIVFCFGKKTHVHTSLRRVLYILL